MKAKLKSGIILKKFIDTTKEFIKTINFNIDKYGISLQGIEDADMALANLYLNYQIFQELTVKQSYNFEISLAHIVKVFRNFEDDDTVYLSMDEDNTTLNLVFQNLEGDTISTFNIPTMNSESKNVQRIPDIKYFNAVVMASNEISKICSELKNLAEIIEIDASQEFIKFNIGKNDIKAHRNGIEHIEGGYVQVGTKSKSSNTKLLVSFTSLNIYSIPLKG